MSGDWDDQPPGGFATDGEAAPDASLVGASGDDWADLAEAAPDDAAPDDGWSGGADHTEATLEVEPIEVAADAALVLAARPVAGELLRELAARIQTDPEGLVIDASAVERLPMQVIQVLLAGAGELQAAGRRLSVRNPSFTFGLAFEALGFTGEREIFTVEYC